MKIQKVRRKNGGENVRQKMAGNARGCRKKFYVGRKTPVTKENAPAGSTFLTQLKY